MTNSTSRKIRTFHCTYMTLQDVINIVDDVIEENPEMDYGDFEFQIDEDYGSSDASVEYRTPMTPEEQAVKDREDAEYREKQEAYEKKQLADLLKKYPQKGTLGTEVPHGSKRAEKPRG